jgi:hypothetical protein
MSAACRVTVDLRELGAQQVIIAGKGMKRGG